MAHIAHFKRSSAPLMFAHYTRERVATLMRENVDSSRTHLNYFIGDGEEPGAIDVTREIARRMDEVSEASGRKVQSNSAAFSDWVVTAPADVLEDDLGRFFESTVAFVRGRYGEQNLLGAWVHMDESTPHVHIALTPIAERADGKPSWSPHRLFTRVDLQHFHKDLADYIEHELGYRPEIMTDDPVRKALSRCETIDEYKAAKDEIRRVEDRLERLRRAERNVEAENRELERRAGELDRALHESRGREREAESSYSSREEKLVEMQEKVEDARGRIREFEAEYRVLTGGAARLNEARDALLEKADDFEAAENRYFDMDPDERDEIEERLGTAATRVRSAESSVRDAQFQLRGAEERLSAAEEKVVRLEEHPLRYRVELREARAEVAIAEKAVEDAKERLDDARAEVKDASAARLEVEREREETPVGRLKAADESMEQARDDYDTVSRELREILDGHERERGIGHEVVGAGNDGGYELELDEYEQDENRDYAPIGAGSVDLGGLVAAALTKDRRGEEQLEERKRPRR